MYPPHVPSLLITSAMSSSDIIIEGALMVKKYGDVEVNVNLLICYLLKHFI